MFGVTVAGRPAELRGVETIVGVFVNALPLRVQIDRAASVIDCARSVQRRQIEMREYEHTPLLQIQGWSEIPRGRAMFEHILDVGNYPVDSIGNTLRESSSGFRTTANPAVAERTNYPLVATVFPGPEIRLQIVYDRDIYAPETAKRLLTHWEHVLVEMARQPEQPVGELAMLSRRRATRRPTRSTRPRRRSGAR